MANNWTYKKIEDIAEKVGMGPFGSSIKVETFVPDGIPVVSGQHLHGFRLDEDAGFNFVTEEHADKLKNANVFRGDIIFTHAGNIENVAYIPETSKYERYVASQRQFYMRCDLSKILPSFVVYYFNSHEGKYKLTANSSSVGVPSIAQPVSYLRKLEIPVPPLPEQRAIAGILGALDDKIELNRRMNRTLESMARAVFRQWFVENEDAGNWEAARIKDVCGKVENGGTPRRDQPKYWEPGTIPWLTSGEVRQEIIISTENKISEDGYKNSSAKMWGKGTTVVALYGATAGEVSFIAHELCANQACCGLVPSDGWRYFIYLTLSASENSLASQARGSAQQNLSQQIVADFSIRKPDQKLLDDFNQIVAPMFDQWIANLKESRTLASLRDSLLPKLMKGEVRVKE
ncbi:MAG: restriction endonuclease subunit S [Chloroflexi bacterium]|nr:restriction endonuclease subunit S [Chloroflexota bacterium]MBI1856285.1 restriction endonuclease subunit S [Chloroflexota bacterium]MBI3339295.1 restriction endonuclease subunit S [Chloroflexota bacterium]